LNQCLLSIYQPDGDGPPPPSVNLQEIMSAVDALNQGMRASPALESLRTDSSLRARRSLSGHSTGHWSRRTARTSRARSTWAASTSSMRPTSAPRSNGAERSPGRPRSRSRCVRSKATAFRS